MDLQKAIIQSIGHAARKERERGNDSGAVGWVLIGLGIITLAVPLIGIPLIVAGICKLYSAGA